MKWWLGAVFLGLVALGTLAVLLLPGGKVEVTIVNVGTTPLRSVTVHVTGNSYPIGDIAPGAGKTVRVAAKGESHVELQHDGSPDRLVVDCYFEPGYRGKITAEVTATQVIHVDNETR